MGNDTKDEPLPGLIDLLLVLSRAKRFIAVFVLACTSLSALVVFLLPVRYTGAAVIMPPQEDRSVELAVMGQMAGAAQAPSVASALGLKSPNELYVGILKSRSIADALIDRFRLRELYGEDTAVATRKALARRTTITAEKSGLIVVEFDDEEPARAAAVANGYVDELDRLTKRLGVTEASRKRMFFENQLKTATEALTSAELAFKSMQEETGLLKLDDQGRAIIETAMQLRAQIRAKEIELEALRTSITENHPQYVRGRTELAGMRAQLTKLERASTVSAGDILVATGRVPGVGLEYTRRLRDVRFHEFLYEMLAKQYELAKVEEGKNAVIVQVLDSAVPPDRKSKPHRLLLVALSFIASVAVAVGWSLSRESFRRLATQPGVEAALAETRRRLRHWGAP